MKISLPVVQKHGFFFQCSAVAASLLMVSSCTTSKQALYFKNLPNDTTLTNLISKDFESKIQKSDLLGITVASLSPENTALYNAPQNAEGTQAGYLVDENGNLEFIKLGTIHVEGMTRKELKARLEKDLTPYLAQSVVAVSFLNRHITLIGAVSPQVMPISSEHMTLLDALASSGDIGARGRMDNVLVIRNQGEDKVFKRLDLTDESLFYSPYFYVQPNDIVYVEPVKVVTNNTTRIISYVTAAISFTFFVVDRIFK